MGNPDGPSDDSLCDSNRRSTASQRSESERRESNPRSQLGKSAEANFATWGSLQNWPSTRTFASGGCQPVIPNSEPFAHESRTAAGPPDLPEQP
jgi:hypothetical protein